jgi:hypothetical protein
MKDTPRGCYSLAASLVPSISPYACKFVGFVSPPTRHLEATKVFILIDRIAELSESATYNSILVFDIIPRLNPDGWAHSQLFKSCLLL